ncbi:MAG: aminoacyl-tRNA hydrolase [Parcubacteria group bacterium]
MEKRDFKLVVGLGNPEDEYEGTYHNVGSVALERLSGNEEFKKPFSIWKGKPFKYLKGRTRVYIRPFGFMNESGKGVYSAMKHFGVKPEEILVIHDDADIGIGTYKLSLGGGSAGHNGVKSVIDHLKTENFWRLRIGIRGKTAGKAGDFVLRKILPEDREFLEKALSEIQISYSE